MGMALRQTHNARIRVRPGHLHEVRPLSQVRAPTQQLCCVLLGYLSPREAAVTLLATAVPEPSPAELRAALSSAARHALSRGVTTLADMGRFPLTRPDAPLRDLQARGEGQGA